jgi:hypothetical protein
LSAKTNADHASKTLTFQSFSNLTQTLTMSAEVASQWLRLRCYHPAPLTTLAPAEARAAVDAARLQTGNGGGDDNNDDGGAAIDAALVVAVARDAAARFRSPALTAHMSVYALIVSLCGVASR